MFLCYDSCYKAATGNYPQYRRVIECPGAGDTRNHSREILIS
jgi:hypothetical protein